MSSISAGPGIEEQSRLVRRVRILLVDDDPVDLAYYREILGRAGCTVTACDSHLEALLRLEEQPFDMVLVNQGSDRFVWRCVVDSAAGPEHDTPVVVLTHSRDMVCYFEALNLGAADYLEKPLTGPQLLQAFEPHLRSRSIAPSA
jgi:CheY-like chemotaxis protein